MFKLDFVRVNVIIDVRDNEVTHKNKEMKNLSDNGLSNDPLK